ncbi:MAG: hypothetical protein ACFFFH_16435 [Candidatus Thorarchaeota archaeon]
MYYSKIVSFTLLLMIAATVWPLLIPLPIINHGNTQEYSQSESKSYIHPKIKNMDDKNQNSPPPIQSNTYTQEFEEWKLFWVPNVDTMDHYQINATLRVVGPHNLIYSDLSPSLNPTFIAMNQTFETTIYPKLHEFYGSPPDIDDNDRVIILVFDIIDGLGGGQYVAGFFYPLNQYLNKDLQPSQRFSNEAEILCIDGNEGLSNLVNGEFETLAHEFQHMIHFGHDDDENLWLDEGASMFAEYLVGRDPFGGTSTYKSRFSSHPDVSLTYWDYYDSENLVMANYGASFAFFLYLAEHYGESNIIQNLVTRPENGIASVLQALKSEGILVQFKEVFRNWTIANFLDDTSFANGTYGYYNTSISMSVEDSYFASTLPRTENSVPYWATDYIRFTSRMGQPFILEFQGDMDSKFIVTAILTNNTTPPFNTAVIPIDISSENFGNFSIEDKGISADEIVITISSYTPIGPNDHSDEDPAPAQDYWFMVNPKGIVISQGILSFSQTGLSLSLSDIQVSDQNGFYWEEADGAIYTILTDAGESTGISGNLTFNSNSNFWKSDSIDISNLIDVNQTYQVKYYFFNSTHSGCTFSQFFSVEESTPSQSSDESTSSTNGIPIPGFMLVMATLAITLLIGNKRKK